MPCCEIDGRESLETAVNSKSKSCLANMKTVQNSPVKSMHKILFHSVYPLVSLACLKIANNEYISFNLIMTLMLISYALVGLVCLKIVNTEYISFNLIMTLMLISYALVGLA